MGLKNHMNNETERHIASNVLVSRPFRMLQDNIQTQNVNLIQIITVAHSSCLYVVPSWLKLNY